MESWEAKKAAFTQTETLFGIERFTGGRVLQVDGLGWISSLLPGSKLKTVTGLSSSVTRWRLQGRPRRTMSGRRSWKPSVNQRRRLSKNQTWEFTYRNVAFPVWTQHRLNDTLTNRSLINTRIRARYVSSVRSRRVWMPTDAVTSWRDTPPGDVEVYSQAFFFNENHEAVVVHVSKDNRRGPSNVCWSSWPGRPSPCCLLCTCCLHSREGDMQNMAYQWPTNRQDSRLLHFACFNVRHKNI